MLNWVLSTTDKYERMYKRYEKKNPKILKALSSNLAYYLHSLKRNINPQNITSKSIHREQHGVKAIDQSGSGEKLKETRLYIYPDTKKGILHLITIGDKQAQADDVKFCSDYVKETRKEIEK